MRTRHEQHALFTATLVTALGLLAGSCGGGGGSTPAPPGSPSLSITTASLIDGTAGQPYSQSLTATGGTSPYSWNLAAGSSLPDGLALSSVGIISGTPASSGSFSFSVQAKDSAARTATRALALKINPGALTITTSSLLGAIAGQPYTQVLIATGGTPPYTWSLVPGSNPLPPGLVLSSEGTISGTPENPTSASGGIYDLLVQVKDAASQTSNREVRLTIAVPLVINGTSLPDGNIGTQYDGCVGASGGIIYYHWTLTADSQPLPAGLSFEDQSFSACIRGVPTQSGTFNIKLQVTDSGSPQQTVTATIRLFIDNRLTVPSFNLPGGVVNQPYSGNLQAVGGTPPYSWTITVGTLPAGLVLSAPGELSGTPVQAGGFSLQVQVTDSATPSANASGWVSLFINPPVTITTTRLDDAVQGRQYFCSIFLNGGRSPLTLRVASGALPPGLNLISMSGYTNMFALSGTPSALGTFSFTLEAADSFSPPVTTTSNFNVRVAEPLTATTTSLPEGWTGDLYDSTLTATGGIPPYFWWTGDLPAGLSLDSFNGRITGTPTQAYNSGVYISVHDSASPQQYAYLSLPLRIIGRLGITTSRLPAARSNVAYRVSLGLFGGTAPYAWSITSGALPTGLSLNIATGAITGTPATEETRSFTVQVADTGPPLQTTSRQLTLVISNSLGRNDSIATATPLSNGTYRASLSPYADPVSGSASPDNDYYAVTATPGAVVSIETMAERLVPPSPVDTVIEILDSGGNRYSTCHPGDYPYQPFTWDCLSDDINYGTVLDSQLQFLVPGTPDTPLTFYVHVLDWGGRARPEFVYDLIVSGAN